MIGRDGLRSRRDAEFTRFADAYAPALRRTAYLLCSDWHLAQDLTQTALTKTYVAWRRDGPPDSPFAYARRTLTRCWLDHLRRRSSGETPTDELPDLPDGSRSLGESGAVRVTLLQAVGTLAPRDRAIVVLRYWEDLGVDQVADLLGLTADTVRVRSSRALRRLRPLLADDLLDDRSDLLT